MSLPSVCPASRTKLPSAGTAFQTLKIRLASEMSIWLSPVASPPRRLPREVAGERLPRASDPKVGSTDWLTPLNRVSVSLRPVTKPGALTVIS